jgi:hypothetical protein
MKRDASKNVVRNASHVRVAGTIVGMLAVVMSPAQAADTGTAKPVTKASAPVSEKAVKSNPRTAPRQTTVEERGGMNKGPAPTPSGPKGPVKEKSPRKAGVEETHGMSKGPGPTPSGPKGPVEEKSPRKPGVEETHGMNKGPGPTPSGPKGPEKQ